MLIHHPNAAPGLSLTESLQQQWAALEAFHSAGKARAIGTPPALTHACPLFPNHLSALPVSLLTALAGAGVSNFCNHAMEAVLATAKIKPSVNQFLYHAGMGPDPDGAQPTRVQSRGLAS